MRIRVILERCNVNCTKLRLYDKSIKTIIADEKICAVTQNKKIKIMRLRIYKGIRKLLRCMRLTIKTCWSTSFKPIFGVQWNVLLYARRGCLDGYTVLLKAGRIVVVSW